MSRKGEEGEFQFDRSTILQITGKPELRWHDDPKRTRISQALMVDPDDWQLRELFFLHLKMCQEQALMGLGDPFYSSYPLPGQLQPLTGSSIHLCTLPNGQPFCLPLSSFPKNMLISGAPGGGKTNLFRHMIAQVIHKPVTTIAFDKKGDLVECKVLANSELVILVFDYKELRIALLQNPPNIERQDYFNSVTELFARHFDLHASRRLLLQRIQQLTNQKEEPTAKDLEKFVEDCKPTSNYGREAGYREALLAALTFLNLSFGDSLSYGFSDMIEQLVKFEGLVVIRTLGLDDSMSVLLASLFIHFAYELRRDPKECENPIIFLLDDAMQLVKGSMYTDVQVNSNPISAWGLMGRSRKLGLCVGVQNFSLVSPEFKHACETVIATHSKGDDAQAVGRFMRLSPEQTSRIATLKPGEIVVLSSGVYPNALFGLVPEVP